ncbi:MAG: Hsp20/alpha crystallin family protein [Gammaproteobacteria bacterium]
MSKLFALKKLSPLTIKQGNPFTALQNELDRAMEEFNGMDIFEDLHLLPKIDIVDDKDSFKVEVEMPGMGEDDVKVNIKDGVLTISGEKSTSTKDKDKNYVMREITYGNYLRQVVLPDSVDIDKATASFKKGMLWVSMPKKAGSKEHSREIPVERK